MSERIGHGWIEKEREVYSKYDTSVTADALKSPIQRQRIDNALAMIGSAGAVLDLGGNDGHVTKMIEDLGNRAINLDFPGVLRYARKDIERVGGTWTHLPFRDGSFDLLYLGECIEHVVDMDPFMAELKRVLKDGGRLVITTPNVARARNRIEMLKGIHTMGFFQHLEFPRHIRFYTHFTLSATLQHYGFKIKKIAGGESEGGNIDWSGISDEEREFLTRLILKLTPEPKEILLSSFVVMEAELK